MPSWQIIAAAVVVFAAFLIGRASVRRRKPPHNPIRDHIERAPEPQHRTRAPGPSGDPEDMIASLSAPERTEIERLIRSGKKINAIKELREATGRGLKESKEAIDWLETRL